jgi:hypothetical protein
LAKLEEMIDARAAEGRPDHPPPPTVWPLIPQQAEGFPRHGNLPGPGGGAQ